MPVIAKRIPQPVLHIIPGCLSYKLIQKISGFNFVISMAYIFLNIRYLK